MKITLPFTISLNMKELQTQHSPMTVTNPYSEESCTLPRYAVKVYEKIKDAELKEDYKTVRKGIDWFQKNFIEQYYTLLD